MAFRTAGHFFPRQSHALECYGARLRRREFFRHTSARSFSFSYPVPRKLRDVVKMSLFQTESPASIKQLWEEQYRSNRKVVSATTDRETFERFRRNLAHCPFFIAPLRRGEGFFNLVLQAQDQKQVLFTSLELFRKSPATAPAYYCITTFDELLEDKGLALLRGDVISAEISRVDAEFLLHYLRSFYTDADQFQWVEKFNHKSREFDFDEFLSRFKDHIPVTDLPLQS